MILLDYWISFADQKISVVYYLFFHQFDKITGIVYTCSSEQDYHREGSMTKRVVLNEVKVKVRHNAILLQEFTIAELIKLTCLNPESVRTEIQRMKKEGLIISEPGPKQEGKRGGRAAIYRLSHDPLKRIALAESVEAFHPISLAEKPTSEHYILAKQLIDQAQFTDPTQRLPLLADAREELEIAEQAEGGNMASKPIKACLDYEHGRLVYLNKQYEEAHRVFTTLREFFVKSENELMTKQIDEFLFCLGILELCRPSSPGEKIGGDEWLNCVLSTWTEGRFQTDSPLVLFLMELIQKLAKPGVAFNETSEVVRTLGLSELPNNVFRVKVTEKTTEILRLVTPEPQQIPDSSRQYLFQENELVLPEKRYSNLTNKNQDREAL